MPNRRRLLLAAVPALLLLGATAWYWTPAHDLLFGPRQTPGVIRLSGNIEAHESVLSFTAVQAPITRLLFDEGQQVKAGTVLAEVDDRVYRAQLAIDTAQLEVASRQLEVARSNLAASASTVTADRLDLTQKRQDARRAAAQHAAGAVSAQDADLAATAAGVAAAALARDQALDKVAHDNAKLAEASHKAASAKVEVDRVTLGYTRLPAPFDGVLAVRQAEVGELAGPGIAIFSLDDLDHVWLRAYVNEPDVGRVKLGQAVTVRTDGRPGHVYRGRVSFISPQAEFTPKTVQTYAERVTLVYRIRIDLANPDHTLLPGMPADASIETGSGGG